MPAVIHPYRVQIAIIGSYGAIGIFVSTVVWLLKGPNLGELVLLICSPYILSLLILPLLVRLGRRQIEVVRDLLAGNGLLAHWTYSPAEWRRYAVGELIITARISATLLVLIYAAVFALILLLATITSGRVDPVDVEAGLLIATLFTVPTVIGLFVASLSRYAYNAKHPGDVWIGRSGVYMSGRWYTWGLKYSLLRGMRLVHQPPRQLHFVIEFLRTGTYPGFWYSVRVPVPEGEEQRAAQIYALVTGNAQPEAIARRMLVERLRELGFFDLVDPVDLEGVLERAESSGRLFVPEVGRTFPFASGLSSEAVLADLESLVLTLQRLGLPNPDLSGHLSPDAVLTVHHQGTEWLLLLPFEVQEAGGWQVATIRVAALANMLLSGCSSENRAYAMSSEDRGLVAILTPEMVRTLWPDEEEPTADAVVNAQVEHARLIIPRWGITSEAVGELGSRLLRHGLQIVTETAGGEGNGYLVIRVAGKAGKGIEEAILRVVAEVPLPKGSFVLVTDARSSGLEHVIGTRIVH